MTDEQLSAIWIPFWYELDQALEVGKTDDYWFFVDRPSWIDESLIAQGIDQFDEVFHCGPSHSNRHKVVRAKVISISYDELGSISKVDTSGLDYTVTLADGSRIREAEEQPGSIEGNKKITDWGVRVILSKVE